MGLITGLSGVDGSGKTTTARLVVERLRTLRLEATYHHEINFLLLKPIFGLLAKVLGRKRSEDVKEQVLSGVERGRPLYSDIYYILVWLDNLIAYLYFKLRRAITIHDRWLYDFTTFFEHKHYKNRLVMRLFTIFPRPDLLILLTVPPEIAFLRKRDDIAHINHGLQYYQDMQSKALENAHRWNYDAIINTNRPIDNVVDDILAVIAESTSNRIATG